MDVGLFNAQDNLPGNSDPVEQVVDEAHVVDERVHVARAQHEQRRQALQRNGGGTAIGSQESPRFDSELLWR